MLPLSDLHFSSFPSLHRPSTLILIYIEKDDPLFHSTLTSYLIFMLLLLSTFLAFPFPSLSISIICLFPFPIYVLPYFLPYLLFHFLFFDSSFIFLLVFCPFVIFFSFVSFIYSLPISSSSSSSSTPLSTFSSSPST